MATSTGVKYIGKNVVYEDNILRTGLTWSKGETHILPKVMAKEFLKHPGMFAEVPGASYLIASSSGEGVEDAVVVLTGIVKSGQWIRPPAIFRLRVKGVGAVSVDSADSSGSVSRVADYQGAVSEQILYPYLGDSAIYMRVTYPVSAVVEVV